MSTVLGSIAPWLRFDDEASVCPGCASSRITLIDAFSIPRDAAGRRVSFLTGCHGCGLLFANPLPDHEHLAGFYANDGAWAARREERTGRLEAARRQRGTRKPALRKPGGPRRRRDVLLDALAPYVPVDAPPPGARVLDVGCGDGKLLDGLLDRGWETYGIESSSDFAFLYHQRLDTPPQDGRFDLVMLHHVLEHVTNPLGLLRQLGGTTREGGALFISVPRLDTLPLHGDFHYCINGRTHPVSYSRTCLEGLLARAGFAVTAHLDAHELDDALTRGEPLRLRLLATRTATPPAPPNSPLRPAFHALRQYARARGGIGTRVRRMLPVRLRAALMDRARGR